MYICTYILFTTSSEIPEVSRESGNFTDGDILLIRNFTDSELFEIKNCTNEMDVNQVGWADRFIYLQLGIGAVVIGIIFQEGFSSLLMFMFNIYKN